MPEIARILRVIVHGSFDTAHNLKVVGSNPTPATNFPANSVAYPLLSRDPPEAAFLW